MATVPLSGTNVRLLSGVPFYNDYKDTRWFDNADSQLNYFYNRNVIHQMTQANFQRIEGRSFISVNKSIDELWQTNYLMFQNASYNNKWFYAFVTKLEYSQKNVTYVHFQIDVLQTWRFECVFKPSFVLREHCKLWNEDGSPVRNTVPEKLHYGDAYDIVFRDTYHPNGGMKWLVIVANSALHNKGDITVGEILGTHIGVPQTLCYYLIPFYPTGKQINVDGTFQVSDPAEVLFQLYTDTQAVNRVVSAYVSEFVGVSCDITVNAGNNEGIFYDSIDFNGVDQYVDTVVIGTNSQALFVQGSPRFWPKKQQLLLNKYAELDTVFESKLWMYPYTVGILTDFKGNQFEFKLEDINNQHLTVLMRGALGPSHKTMFALADYNNTSMGALEETTQPTAMDNALIDSDPHDIPVINDYLAAFLQGHRNSLQAQRNNATFNGAMNVASGAIGMVASATSPLGTKTGMAQGAVNTVQGAGNAVLQLQAIQAQIKDVSNIPPSLSKMGSNIAFDYGNDYSKYHFMYKQIKPEYQAKLADFFWAYGYAVNELKIPNLHTRQNWNYVQTLNCRILADINNEDLEEVKSIYNSGITLWHTDYIGDYDLANGVIA